MGKVLTYLELVVWDVTIRVWQRI